MPDSFSKKLQLAFSSKGQLCVGIDPHEEILNENGFECSAEGVYAFSMRMMDELDGRVSIIKPQVSFFERFGSLGFASLEKVLISAAQRKFLVIADAKRGDIGSTMEAYTQAWLSKSAPFMCDALTLSPYLGVGSLAPAIAEANERGKGLFVLAATSNPDGAGIQKAISGSNQVAKQIALESAELNKSTATTKDRFGHIGLVIGATVKLKEFGLQNLNQGLDNHRAPVLAPGFGYQGARLEDAKRIFGDIAGDVVYTISRSALRDGIHGLASAVEQDQHTLSNSLME